MEQHVSLTHQHHPAEGVVILVQCQHTCLSLAGLLTHQQVLSTLEAHPHTLHQEKLITPQPQPFFIQDNAMLPVVTKCIDHPQTEEAISTFLTQYEKSIVSLIFPVHQNNCGQHLCLTLVARVVSRRASKWKPVEAVPQRMVVDAR